MYKIRIWNLGIFGQIMMIVEHLAKDLLRRSYSCNAILHLHRKTRKTDKHDMKPTTRSWIYIHTSSSNCATSWRHQAKVTTGQQKILTDDFHISFDRKDLYQSTKDIPVSRKIRVSKWTSVNLGAGIKLQQ